MQKHSEPLNCVRHRAADDGVVASIETAGGKAIAVVADVASESEVVCLFETVDRASYATGTFIDLAGGR